MIDKAPENKAFLSPDATKCGDSIADAEVPEPDDIDDDDDEPWVQKSFDPPPNAPAIAAWIAKVKKASETGEVADDLVPDTESWRDRPPLL